jgi:hypothetical protein
LNTTLIGLLLRKKALLIAFLIAVMVGCPALVSTVHFGKAQTGTNVTGEIIKDTTWTLSNSPYNLTGNIVVNNNITLTVEPGVFVNLSSYDLTVNGALRAIGSSKNPIDFNGDNSAELTFTQFAADWNKSTGSGCVIENANLIPYTIMYNSPEIEDDNIYGRINTNASATISNCFIYGGLDIIGGQGIVSNNTINGQGIIITPFSINSTVSDNTITGCSEGITVNTEAGLGFVSGNFTSLIEGNLIADNTYGIELVAFSGSALLTPLIQCNTIADNTCGLYFASFPSGEPTPATIIDNNICDNSNYNVILNVTNDVTATGNWWGTTNAQSINQTIYDFKNDPNWGNVSFVPFLYSPNIQAPTFVNVSAGDNGYIVPWGYVRVDYGGSQTFTITPDYGYYIVDVFVNGTSVGAVSSCTVQNVNGATTISATFAPNPTLSPTSVPVSSSSSSSFSSSPTAAPTTSASLPPIPITPEFPSLLVVLAVFMAVSLSIAVLVTVRKSKIIKRSDRASEKS